MEIYGVRNDVFEVKKIFGFDQKLVQSPRKYSLDIVLIILCKNMVSIVEVVSFMNDRKFQKIDTEKCMCDQSYVCTQTFKYLDT